MCCEICVNSKDMYIFAPEKFYRQKRRSNNNEEISLYDSLNNRNRNYLF